MGQRSSTELWNCVGKCRILSGCGEWGRHYKPQLEGSRGLARWLGTRAARVSNDRRNKPEIVEHCPGRGQFPSTRADVRLRYQKARGRFAIRRRCWPAPGSRPGSGNCAPGRSVKRPAPAGFPIPGAPDTDTVVPVRWLVPVTVRDAEVSWIVVPGAPAQNFGRAPLPPG